MTTEQRKADRGSRKAKPAYEPLLPLMPELQHGRSISFWEDELRLDLAQEAFLALLEGNDPRMAVDAYRQREVLWCQRACFYQYVDDIADDDI